MARPPVRLRVLDAIVEALLVAQGLEPRGAAASAWSDDAALRAACRARSADPDSPSGHGGAWVATRAIAVEVAAGALERATRRSDDAPPTAANPATALTTLDASWSVLDHADTLRWRAAAAVLTAAEAEATARHALAGAAEASLARARDAVTQHAHAQQERE